MAINTLKLLFENCTILDDTLVVESKIAEIIELIKNKYGFDVLKKITANKTDENIEIKYTLFSSEDVEECKIMTHISNEAESICHIFNEAESYEQKIHKEFGVIFNPNL